MEGPSKADLECSEESDGVCVVRYKPTEPGNYIVNVKFADQHVPGSLLWFLGVLCFHFLTSALP